MAVPEAVEKRKPLLRRPAVARLLLIALLAEIGYAVLNLSTMPVYLQFDRGYSASVIGVVLVAFVLTEALFKSPMGALADKISRKRLVVIGPALTVFTALATLIVPHDVGAWETIALVTLRAFDGIGAAMLWPAAFALMGDTVEDDERQQGMSLLNLCYLGGVAFAFPVGGFMNDVIGPHLSTFTGERSASLWLAAILFAAVAVTAYFFLPSDTKRRNEAKAAGEHQEASFKDLLLSMRDIPQYLALAVVTFMGVGFPMSIVKLFAEEQFGMSESSFGLMVLPAVAAMALFSVPMSKLGERIGRARAVHVGLFLCMAGTTVIALGAFLPFMRSAWVIAIGGMPVGIGFLLTIPAWYASVSDLDPKKRGANLGAIMTAQGVGAIIGLPLGGVFYDKLQPVGVQLGLGEAFGRYSPFLGCAVCIFIGWLLSVRVLKSHV
ncbi:MAG: MFS transporter [Fimbriimonadaceae bacterium]|nr:MFS transporter [Fimbriimonadaceae bacterium]